MARHQGGAVNKVVRKGGEENEWKGGTRGKMERVGR